MDNVGETRRRSLPFQPTVLLGRDRQEASIRDLLGRDDVRLVTLTGPGGIGKTSLALQVARGLVDVFADGIGFVPLAPIDAPGLVVSTIGQALGLREQPGVPVSVSLDAELRDRAFLLVLDNFEQVLPAATDVQHLLAACPRLKILVTSRARLHLRGEQEFPVPPLPLPDPAVPPTVATIARNSAVALFARRAREVDPDFAVTAANAGAVAEICRRLDGLPLAIELAAARTKILPPAAMTARLDRRLPLLIDGPRDLPERLRTMRDAIAWSYDLLSDGERALFRQLSVFVRGGSLHAVESVASRGGEESSSSSVRLLDSSTVLDGIAALADNSLLRQEEQADGEPRFLLLETIREFGLEEVEARGEGQPIRERHAAYYLALAEAAAVRLRGAERTLGLDRLEREHDNLRAALSWLRDQGDAQRALRLAGALWQFWWWRSHLAEGRERLTEVLALPGAEARTVARARALTGAGALAETQGDVGRADAYHEEAERVWHELNDRRGLTTSLLFRWLVAFDHDDQNRMTALATESLGLSRDLDDTWGTAMSLMELGVIAMRRHDRVAAEALLAEGRDLFQRIKDAWGEAICTGALANVSMGHGEVAPAIPLLRESLNTLLVLDDKWGLATVLPAAARMAADLGQVERAVRLSAALTALQDAIGAPLKTPFRERFERNLATARTAMGEDAYATAWAAGTAMTPAEAVELAFAAVAEPAAVATAPAATVAGAAVLTPREREVLRLIERTAREIAAELFIAESTVRTHIDHMLTKLDLKNQKALVAYAYQHGLA